MDKFIKGYMTEYEVEGNESLIRCTKYNEILHQETTDYQKLAIIKNDTYGRCLYLDDIIQLSEKDEFVYQEMIAFLPLNSHSNPKRVLIIGGGDGGVAREVLKHPNVEEVYLCEIDEKVITASKKFLPFTASSFDSPKLKVTIQDGQIFVKQHKNFFDIIITDSSDPIGPAKSLFQSEYYQSLYECLRQGGIICSQAETVWFHLPLIKRMYSNAFKIYKSVAYAIIMVPSYPSGQIGFLLASKNEENDFKNPKTKFTDEQVEAMALRYYCADIHSSAFVLPVFVKKALKASVFEK